MASLPFTVNVFAVFLVFVILLHVAGYNVTAVLAGLGVGGIAIAFAAQKTLENLFGGVSIIFDKPIRVGDSCRIGDQSGTVVDIGLRSTRFRTDDRTMLTVPNGQLSVMNLENFGMRDKIRFRHIVSVSIETKADQMRRLLDSLHKLLAEHPMVERSTARVRLVRFGARVTYCTTLGSVSMSRPFASETAKSRCYPDFGRVPERPKGAVCKIAGVAYGGSNPPPPTKGCSQNETPRVLKTPSQRHLLDPRSPAVLSAA